MEIYILCIFIEIYIRNTQISIDMDNIITPYYAKFFCAAFIPYGYKFCFQYSFLFFMCILYCESFCFVLD